MASTGEVWKLGHRPALDGVRTLAIGLVLLAHTDHTWGTAGAIGVTVFFTLSGFLITNILLEEHGRTGRVRLSEFYRRRAYRLMPAMVTLVAVSMLLAVVMYGRLPTSGLVLGTLTYTANFVMMTAPDVSMSLGHTWSLAIEEQFYLLWPLALIVLSRWPLGRILVVLAYASLSSLVLRMLLWDGTVEAAARIYNGPDTRADSLLIGCALAFVLHNRPARRVAPGAAPVGLIVIGVACFGSWQVTHVLAPMVVGLASAAVIFSAVNGGARGFEWGPLVWIGRRSYGLYLFHAPALYAAGWIFGDSTLGRLLVGLPLALVLMVASWRYVEVPFLRWRDQGERPATGDAEVFVSRVGVTGRSS